MRVYVPATFDALKDLADTEALEIPSGVGFALTDAVREFYTSGDDEELAYTAFSDAARASLRLLNQPGVQNYPNRRVVIAADIPDEHVEFDPDNGESVVGIDPPVLGLDTVASFHVDDADAEKDTEAAREAILAADLDDNDAEFIVNTAEDNLLSWYDSKELPVLVGLL